MAGRLSSGEAFWEILKSVDYRGRMTTGPDLVEQAKGFYRFRVSGGPQGEKYVEMNMLVISLVLIIQVLICHLQPSEILEGNMSSIVDVVAREILIPVAIPPSRPTFCSNGVDGAGRVDAVRWRVRPVPANHGTSVLMPAFPGKGVLQAVENVNTEIPKPSSASMRRFPLSIDQTRTRRLRRHRQQVAPGANAIPGV